jgi:hypothetical protein
LKGLPGNGCVIGYLAPQPPSVAQTEVAAKPKIGVGRDGALAGNDLADPLRGHANVLGETVLGEPKRLEEFLFKHFTRRDWENRAHGASFSDSRRFPHPWRHLLSRQNRPATAG